MEERIEISEDAIENFTKSISGFDEKREYLGLSLAAKTPEEIASAFIDGYYANHKETLKCYKGYQMEKDLIRRLQIIYPNSVSTEDLTIKTGILVESNPSLIGEGHPDYWFEGYPGEIKSVLKDSWLPDHRIPTKHYWQMQAYMLYSGKEKGVLVYESRESGLIRVKIFNSEERTQNTIHQKYIDAAKLITER